MRLNGKKSSSIRGLLPELVVNCHGQVHITYLRPRIAAVYKSHKISGNLHHIISKFIHIKKFYLTSGPIY